MKKKIFVLILFLLLTAGCSNINNASLDDIIDKVITDDSRRANQSLVGYKIYLPINMTLINNDGNNAVLYSNGHKYYLYADMISYQNNEENDYKVNNQEDAYYYKEFVNDDTKGYVLITKGQDGYFCEIAYNYAKIETVTDDIKESVTKALTVLNSLKYNDYVVNSLVGNNILNYNEEEYQLATPNSSVTSDNFLQYEEEYGTYVDTKSELPNSDVIDLDTNN